MLSSCTTVSENPLSSPETSRPDPRLVGAWRGTSDTAHDSILRFSITKGSWMHVTITEPGKKEKPESYDLFPTVIGRHTFLNVVMTGKDDKGRPTKNYFFIRYSISSDHELRMWSMSQDEAASAIREGKLKGIVKEDKNPLTTRRLSHPDVDVVLQDTSANLFRYIQKHDVDDLFDDEMSSSKRVGN